MPTLSPSLIKRYNHCSYQENIIAFQFPTRNMNNVLPETQRLFQMLHASILLNAHIQYNKNYSTMNKKGNENKLKFEFKTTKNVVIFKYML